MLMTCGGAIFCFKNLILLFAPKVYPVYLGFIFPSIGMILSVIKFGV